MMSAASPSLLELLEELGDVTNWRQLGVYLGVKRSKLDVIEVRYLQSQGVNRCKEEVLNAWLRGNPDASWKGLVNALEKIEEDTLAARLSVKYLRPASNALTAVLSEGGNRLLCNGAVLLVLLAVLLGLTAIAFKSLQQISDTPPVSAPSSANPSMNVPTSANPIPSVTVPTSANPIPSVNVPTSANPIPSVTVPTSANPIPLVNVPTSTNHNPSVKSIMLELPTITNSLDFCICLDLLYSHCEEIVTDNPLNSRKQVTKMVAKWLETSEFTWEKIVDALFCHQHIQAAVRLAAKKGVDWKSLQSKWKKH